MNNELIQTFLSNIGTVILSVFSTRYFFHCFFERKQLKHIFTVWIYLISSLAFFVSLQFVEDRLLNMTILIGCTLILSRLFEMRWYNNILFTLLFIAISSICELMVATITVLLFSVEFSEVREGVLYLAGMFLSKFIALVLFATLKIVKHHSLTEKRKQGWCVLFLFPITTLLILLIQFYIMRHYLTSSLTNNIILLSMICLIICNLCVVRFIDTIWQVAEQEQKLAVSDNLIKEQEHQYALIVKNNSEITKIQHDYKNILLGIQSELIGKRYDEAIQSIQSQLSLVSMSNSTISGNNTIDTIVKAKTSIARDFGIIIDFQFRNIRNLKIDSLDLAILLGNALDNAIEAASKVNADQKTITLLIVLKNDTVSIVLKNPVEKTIDTDHLVTSKKDKRLHGYGIINMRTIVNRYNGSLFFTCEELYFRTIMLIPNTPPLCKNE